MNKVEQLSSDTQLFQNYRSTSNSLTKKNTLQIIIFMCIGIFFVFLLYLSFSKSNQISEEDTLLRNIKSEADITHAESHDLHSKKKLQSSQTEGLSKEKEQLNKKISDLKTQIDQYQQTSQSKKDMALKLSNQITDIVNKQNEVNQINNKEIENLKLILFGIQDQIKVITDNIASMKNQLGKVIDSSIITTKDQLNVLQSWIGEVGKIGFQLLYRGTSDNFNLSNFHNTCDRAEPPLLFLIKTSINSIIGGYTKISTSQYGINLDQNAFIFNLDIQKKYMVNNPSAAVYNNRDLFIMFGDDLNLDGQRILSNFPSQYGNKVYDQRFGLTNGNMNLQMVELEVYSVNFAYNI